MLELPEVFRMGAILTVVNLLIWIVLGGAWWKVRRSERARETESAPLNMNHFRTMPL